MQKLVLDTNIIISAALSDKGNPSIACKGILITENTKHYPNEPFILTPMDFLKILVVEQAEEENSV